MQDEFIHALRGKRAQIHAQWETLLRTERVTSPMANPDTLVYLIESTLDHIFAALEGTNTKHRGHHATADCPCGRNPLLAYFHAGEQVLLEALILIQAATPNLLPATRDAAVAELRGLIRDMAGREINAFCALCQYRTVEFDPTAHARPRSH